MKLKAVKHKSLGAILVHQKKPSGAPTDLVAEVHSGFDDAKHIADCVNVAEQESISESLGLKKKAAVGKIVLSKGKIFHAEGSERDLRRIDACIRACERESTSSLIANGVVDGAYFKATNERRIFMEREAHKWRIRCEELQERYNELLSAAKAVVERWDSPLWKDLPPTAKAISRLRDAVNKLEGAQDEQKRT